MNKEQLNVLLELVDAMIDKALYGRNHSFDEQSSRLQTAVEAIEQRLEESLGIGVRKSRKSRKVVHEP